MAYACRHHLNLNDCIIVWLRLRLRIGKDKDRAHPVDIIIISIIITFGLMFVKAAVPFDASMHKLIVIE